MKKNQKTNNPSIPKLAIVTWLDAFDGPTGWIDPHTYKPKAIRPITVGWVIAGFLDEYVTLIGTYFIDTNEDVKDSEAECYSNPTHIPLKMVQSITYIDTPTEISALILSDYNTRGFNAN